MFHGPDDGDAETADFTMGSAVAVDAAGRAYLVGNTNSPTLTMRNGFQTTWGGDDTTGFSSDKLGDAFLAVFDPAQSGNASLVYSTFLGGPKGDAAYGVTIDGNGNAVVVGRTASNNLPTNGGIQPLANTTNAFVARINASAGGAASLVESSMFGGRPNQVSEARGATTDVAGNVYVVGTTRSPDFLVLGPAQGANRGGTDAFVLKMSSTASTADLEVTSSATPDPVTQGENLTITFTIKNNSATTAVDKVFLSDLMYANDTFVSASATPASVAERTVNFALGSIAPGQTRQVQVVIRVGASANPVGGGLNFNSNSAIVRGDRPDGVASNNSVDTITALTQKTAELGVSAAIGDGAIIAGEDFTYRVTVRNNGPDAAPVIQGAQLIITASARNFGPETAVGAQLVVTLPAGLSFVSTTRGTESNGVVTLALGDLASGAPEESVTIVAQATGLGALQATARATATSPIDPASSNDTANLSITTNPPNADLGVILTANRGSVAQGGQFSYTATIQNLGPLTADAASLEITLGSGLTFVSTTQGTHVAGVVTVPISALALNGTSAVTVVVEATGAGQLTAVAKAVASSPADLNANNNEAASSVISNAPITLNQVITITYGNVATPAYSGYPSRDLVAMTDPISTEAYNAIAGAAGLDARVLAALTALRDATPANPTNLKYFSGLVSLYPNAAVFGNIVQKPIKSEVGGYNSLANNYRQLVTGSTGSILYTDGPGVTPLTFQFPELTDAASGQVRNGVLTVNFVQRDAVISGPIATTTHVTALNGNVLPGETASYTATVVANGAILPPAGSLIEYTAGPNAGTAVLDADGKATFSVQYPAAGDYSVVASLVATAEFAGGGVPITQNVGDLNGPRITRVDRFGFHMRPTTLVVRFDDLLDAESAANRANYRLLAKGRDGRFGTNDDILLKLQSVVYDATAQTVTLTPFKRLPLAQQFRLVARGVSAKGITDESGTPLDGKGNGSNGSNYSTVISRANLILPTQTTKKAAKKVVVTAPTRVAAEQAETKKPPKPRGKR